MLTVFQQNPPDKDSMQQSSEDPALVGLGHGLFCTGKDPFSVSIHPMNSATRYLNLATCEFKKA
jgi:hypothetical protein